VVITRQNTTNKLRRKQEEKELEFKEYPENIKNIMTPSLIKDYLMNFHYK